MVILPTLQSLPTVWTTKGRGDPLHAATSFRNDAASSGGRLRSTRATPRSAARVRNSGSSDSKTCKSTDDIQSMIDGVEAGAPATHQGRPPPRGAMPMTRASGSCAMAAA